MHIPPNHPQRSGRLSLADAMGVGVDDQTPEDKRRNLVRVLKGVDAELAALPKRDPRRAELGNRKQDLQNEISAIRPKRRAPGIEQHFIDAAREHLPIPVFKIVMATAYTMLKAAQKAAELAAAAPGIGAGTGETPLGGSTPKGREPDGDSRGAQPTPESLTLSTPLGAKRDA